MVVDVELGDARPAEFDHLVLERKEGHRLKLVSQSNP